MVHNLLGVVILRWAQELTGNQTGGPRPSSTASGAIGNAMDGARRLLVEVSLEV